MKRKSLSSLAEHKPLPTATASASSCFCCFQKSPLFSFLLSLISHGLLLLLLYCYCFHFSSKTLSPSPSSLPAEALPEVILDLSPPLPEKRPAILTVSEQPLEQAPKDALFESQENTEAASELPAIGAIALPTQEGEKSDIIELKNSESTSSLKPLPCSKSQAEQQSGTKELSTAALPSPVPTAHIFHADGDQGAVQLEKVKQAISDDGSVSTESPNKPSSSTEHALDFPASAVDQHETSRLKSPSKERPVMGTLSAKAKEEESGSHPSMIRGAISNKGKSSLSAEATPIGRYKKTLADAISSHWYHCIDQRMELLSLGTATLFFYVNQQGKIEEPHILSNTSNHTFSDCCLQSIIETKLPVIPPEIAKTLKKGRLEIEYRFTIYPN